MGQYCQTCGRVMYPPEDKYPHCSQCFINNKKTNNQKETNIIEKEGLDLSKQLNLQLWHLIVVFILGIIIGAWLW